MTFQLLRYSRTRSLVLTLSALAVACGASACAQSVPVPFAGTLAGGGAVCSTSLPVFAVTGTGAKYGDGCPATQATLNVPVAAATDSQGNVFIADQTNQLVRVVYNGGTALAAAIVASNVQNPGLVPVRGNIYTIAGGVTTTPTEATKYCNQAGNGPIGTNSALDGCPGSESEQGPRGLAVDADGNLFIASVSPVSQVRVLYVGGAAAAKLITLENPTITTPQPGFVYNIAGGNSSSFTLDGSLATKATMNTPRGMAIDSSENIYFADQANNVIRRVDGTTGIISTIAGHCVATGTTCTATAPSGDGSPAASTAVNIYSPYGVAFDQYGNLFIAEAGSATIAGRIRVVYAGGTVPGITAPSAGSIYTYAGGGVGTTPAQLATFQEVFGVTLDPSGYLYVTDYRTATTGSNRLWRVDPGTGNIAVIAGNGAAALTAGKFCNGGTTGPVAANTRGDGCPATQAYLANPQEQLAFDTRGNFYIADRVNNVVRSFTYNNLFPPTPTQTSVTQPVAFFYPAGVPTTESFTTQGTTATDYSDAGGDTCPLNTALATATTCVDYVKFTPTLAGQREGTITVTGPTGSFATQSLSGVGAAPVLTVTPPTSVALGSAIQPLGVSVDETGAVNLSDGKGKQVLRTTIAGGATTVALAGLGTPRQSTTDNYGNLFVADSTANRIVERTAAGATVSLGTGLTAPQGVVADLFGNLYVADTGNNRLVYLSPLTGNQRVVPTSGYTLSAPTSLALDASGDLFLIDTNNTRLLELPLGGAPQSITLPSGAMPAALATDPGGNLYLADTASGNILFVPAGSSTATVFASGFTTPAGVAVGSNGNVFVADSAATSAAGFNVALNNSTFTTTNIGLTSLPVTLTLGNAGNLPATLATPAYVETGSASAFPASGNSTCAAGSSLVPAGSCTQMFVFQPTAPGPQSAQVVFTQTGSQTVTANFSGVATNLILTSLALTPANSTVSYGQPVTYTAVLTANTKNTTAPTGTVSFVIDGKTVSTQAIAASNTYTVNLSAATHTVAALYSGDALYAASNASTVLLVNKATTITTTSSAQSATGTVLTAIVNPATTGPATFTGYVTFTVDGIAGSQLPVGNGTVTTTVLLADGSHSFSASYTGDTNYAASASTAQSLTVARNATALALTITPVSTNGSGALQLRAALTSTGTGAPTGTITFTNGATTLGTLNLSTATGGAVTLTTTSTLFTSYNFTATYSGDGLFSSATATATEPADFVPIVPAAGLSVPQGAQGILLVALTPINGYSGTLTATCSNLPANTLCRFQPVPLVLTPTAAVNLTLEVYAGVNPSVASLEAPTSMSGRIWVALLCFLPFSFAWARRRSALPRLAALLLCLATLSVLSGCGNKTPGNVPGSFPAPVGSTNITLNVTDSAGLSRSAMVPLTITQ